MNQEERIAALEAENERLKSNQGQMLEALRRYEEQVIALKEQVARLTEKKA